VSAQDGVAAALAARPVRWCLLARPGWPFLLRSQAQLAHRISETRYRAGQHSDWHFRGLTVRRGSLKCAKTHLPEVLMASKTYDWESSHLKAVLETDNSLIGDRIEHAEEIITRRLWKMPRLQENEEERQIAVRALGSLAVLRKERLAKGMTTEAPSVHDSPHWQENL